MAMSLPTVAVADADRAAFTQTGSDLHGGLNLQPERGKFGNAINHGGGFDTLAELGALFQHDAIDGCGQRQFAPQFAGNGTSQCRPDGVRPAWAPAWAAAARAACKRDSAIRPSA